MYRMKDCFTQWVTDDDKKRKRTAARMTRQLVGKQVQALYTLKSRAEKCMLIEKIKSSYILMRMLNEKSKIMVKGRFGMWQNDALLHIQRLMKRTLFKMIGHAKIESNTQLGFWKWKFIISKSGEELNPTHAIMFKKLSHTAHAYQTRLQQFAFFKLVLGFKSKPSKSRPFITAEEEEPRRRTPERPISIPQRPETGQFRPIA